MYSGRERRLSSVNQLSLKICNPLNFKSWTATEQWPPQTSSREEMRAHVEPAVTPRTIGNSLLAPGLRSRVPLARLPLTPRHHQTRILWSREQGCQIGRLVANWATRKSSLRLIFTMGDLRIFGLLEIMMNEFWANKFCRFLSLFLFSQDLVIVILRMPDMVPSPHFYSAVLTCRKYVSANFI